MPRPTPRTNASDPSLLTIGDLAARTGVTAAVLRAWELRHGFPTPQRLPGGHRRYLPSDVAGVELVQRRRTAGIRLDAAIAEALSSAAPSTASLFAELRRNQPQLTPARLRRSTLIALSHAVEDEGRAGAQRPILFGAFQSDANYRAALPRWNELARVATSTMAMAAFSSPVRADEIPVRVPLAEDAPMRREWAVVSDAPDLAALLTAWELPGQDGVTDADRLYESIWTLDPVAVREGARACARFAQDAGVAGASDLLDVLRDRPLADPGYPTATANLHRRVVTYLDRTGR